MQGDSRDISVMVVRQTRLISVGQVLDKYEILERVGQGGMAIVYRGIDRSLKRTVAVKILHKHLSDYQEARDRFEREAQAVAKLRHENILEIFDYSAKVDSESYIVTEFIDGQTLKQFVTERPITFPEVGAMVMLQVARALAHAHAVGILHRDIKPENIMIRSDGVVKLMDFGISHMVDLERLTVTGQLLGSPAYMAPEHVEGRPLDFRTDVFAVGIVLYQLTVGKLPFEGKNPHEVLKRIAECKFVDPRIANPRIGNRLGKIILRAMAAAPNDRYSAIGEMVIAIEAYLEESGLEADKVTSELARYFKAPVPYEAALKERLLDHLTRRGQKLLGDGEQAPALDVFDRVLTIDPTNEKVRRARFKTIVIGVLAVGAISAGGYMIHKRSQPPTPQPPPDPTVAMAQNGSASTQTTHVEAPPADIDAGLVDEPIDAAPFVRPTNGGGGTVVVTPPPVIDGGLVVDPPVEVTVRATVAGAEWRFPDGAWQPVTGTTFVVPVTQPTRIEVQHSCCETLSVELDRSKRSVNASLQFLAANVRAVCAVPDAYVSVTWTNGGTEQKRTPSLGAPLAITFDKNATSRTRNVTVVFTNGEKTDSRIVTVEAGKTTEVKCAL
jgi:serine/threonine-protein kinase